MAARRAKRESTTAPYGLMSPDPSFNLVAPKQEIDLTDLSDDFEESTEASSFSHAHEHGLPIYEAEYEVIEQQRRSASLSVRTSRVPPSIIHRREAEMTPPLVVPQGLEFVGRDVKLLVDAINDLRNFGLEDTVQLPELVLVGDQSAGKSSLMSALTEVRLPRDQGICTKCPANITTSPANTWSCKISLQQNYRYQDPRGKTLKATKADPFPPWVEQSLVVKQFNTIFNPTELEENIRWAQVALLNHDINHTLFIPNTGARARGDYVYERDNTEAKFSPNCIAIGISGPGLPALSFYDLPGVFRVAPDPKDQYLANVIENLTIKYIKRPNALIIWTLAMKTDPSNSSTGKVIQDCKAYDRCVGVLTNPDHVAARHFEYEKILKGQSHVVRHGYFVTKQPGENQNFEDESYHAQARAAEKQFFDENSLWQGDWSEFLDRCGTTAIQEFLSKELARQIIKTLPSIMQKVGRRSREVDNLIKQCPDLPHSDVRNLVMKHLSEFSNDVKCLMKGDSSTANTGFQKDWSSIGEAFRDLILYMKPTIILTHESDRNATGSKDFIEITSDDDDDVSAPSSPQSSRKRPGAPIDLPSPGRFRTSQTPEFQNRSFQSQSSRDVKNEPMPPPPSNPVRSYGRPNPFSNTPYAYLANRNKGFIGILGIQETIATNICPGLPDVVTPETYNSLCMKSTKPWSEALGVFMDLVFSLVRQQLHQLLRKNLGGYEQTELFRKATQFLNEFLDELETDQRISLVELCRMETYHLFTVNHAAVADNKTKELYNLTRVRKTARARAYIEKQIRLNQRKGLPADLKPEEKKRAMDKLISEVKDEVLGKDKFELEIGVAAYLRAYYITAGLRFVDSVCLSVNGKLFRRIKEQIFYHLETKLEIISSQNGEEICRSLMEEDDTIGRKRRELKTEKQKLAGFTARLDELVQQINSSKASESANDYGASEPSFFNGGDTAMSDGSGV